MKERESDWPAAHPCAFHIYVHLMSHPGDLGQTDFSNYRGGRLELDVCQLAELNDTHFVLTS
jgi:hypothetical protein